MSRIFSNRYWPTIDDALRRAAFDRKVQVRLMASLWNHTRFDMKFYLRSLAALNSANFASVQVVRIHIDDHDDDDDDDDDGDDDDDDGISINY